MVLVRDSAAERLRTALPGKASETKGALVGRKADGADDWPASVRVRFVPLPSIGHHHADRRIRRILVEVPAGCPLRADAVHWAISGLDLCDRETGEVLNLIVPTDDLDMLAQPMPSLVEAIRLQREPFETNGEGVEESAMGTRFAKERLWHVEITFTTPISGPLIIGDGRFLGLGLTAPAPTSDDRR